jgi:hypothetical protein
MQKRIITQIRIMAFERSLSIVEPGAVWNDQMGIICDRFEHPEGMCQRTR